MREIFEVFAIVSLVIIVCLLFVLFAFTIINGTRYYLDQSMCTAYVNQQQVYDDRCHFLSIKSIGEYGNTKKLTIYKDKYKFKPNKIYIHEDIKIGDKQ